MAEVIALRRASPPAEAPMLLRPREVAERLGVHEKTVRRYILAGTLPYVRLGPDLRIVRIPVAALEEFIRSRTVAARNG